MSERSSRRLERNLSNKGTVQPSAAQMLKAAITDLKLEQKKGQEEVKFQEFIESQKEYEPKQPSAAEILRETIAAQVNEGRWRE